MRNTERKRGRSIVIARSGAALAAISLLLSGCTPKGNDEASATRVLQVVEVATDPAGAIAAVESTAIYMDEPAGTTTTSQRPHEVREVVDELPVRLTTHYRTAEGQGSDVSYLTGYTGRVEIDVMVENLTVAPEMVAYDAGGRALETPALVGAPLSVAASTTLPGVSPSQVIMGMDDDSATNGVVSADADGHAQIQWAALLAPPQTEATATFRLTADVVDFAPPVLDVAVEPGLHADLSFQGVVASAFDNGPTSELGIQQRSIAVIMEINEVLNGAGATITEIRKNLADTSETLGVSAIRELSESSSSLATRMEGVQSEIGALQSDLAGTVTSAEAAVANQLSQTVASMTRMLGDTSADPGFRVEGEGCSAQVVPNGSNVTVYSMFMQLSGMLAGYAEADAACRDQMVAAIERLLGPDEPSEQGCTESSMTCSLFQARLSVAASLQSLVEQAEAAVAQLNSNLIAGAIIENSRLGEGLEQIISRISQLDPAVANSTDWDELALLVEEVAAQVETVTISAEAQAERLRDDAMTAIDLLVGAGDSVRQQYQDLSDLICSAEQGAADPDNPASPAVSDEQIQADELLGRITGLSCDGSPVDGSLIPTEGPLTDRLDQQVAMWDGVRLAAEVDGGLGQLAVAVAEISSSLGASRTASETGEVGLASVKDNLILLGSDARSLCNDLGDLLHRVQDNQEDVKENLGTQIWRTVDSTNTEVAGQLDAHARMLIEDIGAERQALMDSHNAIIARFARAADDVLSEGRAAVNDQRVGLETAKSQASASLEQTTTSALERIETSAQSTVRDVAAASAMLADSLSKVLLDLGDPAVSGSGILGAVASSAATSDTADYRLALGSQRAAGYGNVRAQDIAGIMLRQAQFQAALRAADELPAFHMDVPAGAAFQSLYTFHLWGDKK